MSECKGQREFISNENMTVTLGLHFNFRTFKIKVTKSYTLLEDNTSLTETVKKNVNKEN